MQRQVDEDQQPKSAITVRQAVGQWLEVAELGDTTRERYDDLIRLYVLPTLGEMQASKLDAELLERFTRGCTGAALYAVSLPGSACPANSSGVRTVRSAAVRWADTTGPRPRAPRP